LKGIYVRNSDQPFAPSLRSNRNASLEAELKEYDDKRANPDEEDVQPKGGDPKSTATTGYEKRYADLRSYSQKQINELNKTINDLKQQITGMAQTEYKLPKSPEEVAAWIAKFPEVGAMVRTIALQENEDLREEVKKTRTEIAEERMAAAKQIELNRLVQAHPDFFEIRETEEFHEWADQQADWVKTALYDENQVDSKPVIDAVRLYKADTAPAPKKRDTRNEDADAARGVKTSKTAPDVTRDSTKIYESDVDKMTKREFEASADAIDKAMRENRFVYDLSGAAR
jgi:hypothetical protein